jgi:hypothetical protein
LHGITFELATILFNVIWWYARHDRRLLVTTLRGECHRRPLLSRPVLNRYRTLLGTLLPALGMAVIAALIPYWLPIPGEIAREKRQARNPCTHLACLGRTRCGLCASWITTAPRGSISEHERHSGPGDTFVRAPVPRSTLRTGA